MDVLVGILRRPDGLVGVVSRRAQPFAPPSPEDLDAGLDRCDPYLEALVPLSAAPRSAAEQARSLQTAWDALASVSALQRGVLVNVIQLLWGTVLDPDAASVAVLPRQPSSAAYTRRTAAHPRGYQGTKVRPPKRAAQRPVDLRPLLCSPVGMGELLARIAPTFAQIRPLLEGLLPPAALDRLDDADAIRADPWSWSWRTTTPKRILALPTILQRNLIWPIQHLEWSELGGFLTTYWALGLNEDAALRRCVSRLLALAPDRHGLAWSALLARESPERRAHLAELIVESGALAELPAGPDPRQLDRLLEVSRASRDPVYRYRMHRALRALPDEGRVELVLEGCAIANRYAEDARLDEERRVRPHPEARPGAAAGVDRFMSLVTRSPDLNAWERSGFAVELWARCLELPGLTALLASDAWSRLDPRSALDLCSALASVVHDGLDVRDAKWAVLLEAAPRLIDLVAAVPRRKVAIECLNEVIYRYDREATLRSGLRGAEALLPLVCGIWRDDASPVRELFAVLVGPEVDLDRLRNAPARSWRALERSAARRNEARILARGLSPLCARLPGLIEDGLDLAPGPLLGAAGALGVMPDGARARLLDALVRDRLFDGRLAELDPPELVEVVDAARLPTGASPVRRRLRAALRGDAPLTAAQLEGHRRRIIEALPGLRLASIEHQALSALGAFLGAPAALADERVRHAVKMQWFVDEHRRGLRRVIRAWVAGDRGYPSSHPRNQAWLAAHPRVDRQVWLGSFELTAELPGLGDVRLAVENDPLEVLRLGTHAGTCLGLGGGQAYSAAAIMLDVNKRVVFARSRGSVIARQVLAISTDDRLVPFAVYPASAPPAVRALFRSFDEAFARALGIPLHVDPTGPDPRIDLILARSWWDDGAWDLVVAEPTTAHRVGSATSRPQAPYAISSRSLRNPWSVRSDPSASRTEAFSGAPASTCSTDASGRSRS